MFERWLQTEIAQVKSELVGRHLAPPMVSSLFYRALAFYAVE